MENNNKSQAELYREERKERLAKAAAKNAKKSHKAIDKTISCVVYFQSKKEAEHFPFSPRHLLYDRWLIILRESLL